MARHALVSRVYMRFLTESQSRIDVKREKADVAQSMSLFCEAKQTSCNIALCIPSET